MLYLLKSVTYRWPWSRHCYGRQIYNGPTCALMGSAFQRIKGAKVPVQPNYISRHFVRNISLQSKFYNVLLVYLFFHGKFMLNYVLLGFTAGQGRTNTRFPSCFLLNDSHKYDLLGVKAAPWKVVKRACSTQIDFFPQALKKKILSYLAFYRSLKLTLNPFTECCCLIHNLVSRPQFILHPCSMTRWVTSQPSVSEGGTTRCDGGGGGPEHSPHWWDETG